MKRDVRAIWLNLSLKNCILFQSDVLLKSPRLEMRGDVCLLNLAKMPIRRAYAVVTLESGVRSSLGNVEDAPVDRPAAIDCSDH